MAGGRCPSCGEYDLVAYGVPEEKDEDGEEFAFTVCGNCDYGCGAFEIYPNAVRLS